MSGQSDCRAARSAVRSGDVISRVVEEHSKEWIPEESGIDLHLSVDTIYDERLLGRSLREIFADKVLCYIICTNMTNGVVSLSPHHNELLRSSNWGISAFNAGEDNDDFI